MLPHWKKPAFLSDITLRKIKDTNVYLCKYLCVYMYVYVCLLIIFSLSPAFFCFCYSHPFFLPWSYPHLFFVTYWYLFSLFTISFIFSLVFLFVWYLFHYFPFTLIVVVVVFFHLLSQTSENGLHVAWLLPSIPFPLPSYSACCPPELVMAVVFSKAEPFYSEIVDCVKGREMVLLFSHLFWKECPICYQFSYTGENLTYAFFFWKQFRTDY